MAKLLCPHCGAPTEDFSGLDIQSVKLTGLQMRILDVLATGKNRFLPAKRIADLIYANDPNGGPGDAVNVVASSISRIRTKLASVGLGVENRKTIGYRLIKLEDQAGAQ